MSVELILDLTQVTASGSHVELTKILVENRDKILESDLDKNLLANILKFSLYKHFVSVGTWQSLIEEAEKHYKLHSEVSSNLNFPSLCKMDALVEAFRICFKQTIPLMTRRLMTLLSDDHVLTTLALWSGLSKKDLSQLKMQGLLTSEDFRVIANKIREERTYLEECPTFKNSTWYFDTPHYRQQSSTLDSLRTYQGMGWIAVLGECLDVEDEKTFFIRMDGGSNGYDRINNQTYFDTHHPSDFPRMKFDDFLGIAFEIVEQSPAFSHSMVVNAR